MGYAILSWRDEEVVNMEIKFDDAVKAAEQAKDVKLLTLEEAIKVLKAGA